MCIDEEPMHEWNAPEARRIRALQDGRLYQLHPEEEQRTDKKRLRAVLFRTDAAKEIKLTSSPFFPGGPERPREPSGPANIHSRRIITHRRQKYACFHNVILTLNVKTERKQKKNSQENQALRARLGVQWNPEGPVTNTDQHSYISDA